VIYNAEYAERFQLENSGIISINHWGISVYVTYCSCSSNTVSKV